MTGFRAAIHHASSIRHTPRARWIALAVVFTLLGGGLLKSREANSETTSAKGHPLRPLLKVEEYYAHPVTVYVYDDPVFDHAALIQCYRDTHGGMPPWQDERADMAQDMGEIWLHQSLLSHPWRVLDPEDADVFFIPLYPVLGLKLLKNHGTCGGLNHKQRVTKAIMHLVKKSTYFNRFGGADHVVVCAWWNCGKRALSPQHRMLLRRTLVGINENVYNWSMWGCRGRMVTVPYTACSALTTTGAIGGRSPNERDIPFFFVGTGRARPERINLKVAEDLSPDSVVTIGADGTVWSEGASVYADRISRSRFCFCPRGDSASSRRIFDAVSAGCIPVLTQKEGGVLPFLRTGLNYSEFAVVMESGAFDTTESVKGIVRELSLRSDAELTTLREGLSQRRSSVLYGVTTGPELSDMKPFHDTASRFLQEVKTTLNNTGLWHCPASNLGDELLAPRSLATFPMRQDERRQWLRESETIVNEEHKLLFCAPPNTGSLQFRMLAKRMQGVDHWSVSNDQSLLFDPVASELPLLDLADTRLMEDIYKDNDSGWIKIGVVRDPVTRLLSAYLDVVYAWVSTRWSALDHDQRQRRRGLRVPDDWGWFDVIKRHGGLKEDGANQELPNTNDSRIPQNLGEGSEREGPTTSGDALPGMQGGAVPPVPTFEELLDLLAVDLWAAPSAFRPAASLCGMWKSPFDTIIPFESLQRTSTKVLESLPGDIWHSFGETGWGPQGEFSFMEFDYGTAARHVTDTDGDSSDSLREDTEKEEQEKWHLLETGGLGSVPLSVPPHARDLFAGDSCGWTEYYSDQSILEKVGQLYKPDFDLFEWYNLDTWRERLDKCLQGHA